MIYFGVYFLIGVLMLATYMSQDPEGYYALNDTTQFAPIVFFLITFLLMGLFWLPAMIMIMLKGKNN